MAWYLNPALTNFRNAVNARWPNRDRTSDGTIGDKAHQATSSDHNPDTDGSVDAWDMDVDGVDVWACIRAALRHESIQYVIYNRKITSRSWGLGVWRDYTGSNPHDKHVHFNTRASHENSQAPWDLGDNQMPLTSADVSAIWAAKWNTETAALRLALAASAAGKVDALDEKVTELKTAVDTLVNTPPGSVTIPDDQLERVIRRVLGSLDEDA